MTTIVDQDLKDAWLPDLTPISVTPCFNLKEALLPVFVPEAQAFLAQAGFLVDFNWYPLGQTLPMLIEGRQTPVAFGNYTLAVHAVMDPALSAKVHRGEKGGASRISAQVAEALQKMLPIGTRTWGKEPIWDAATRCWIYEFNVVSSDDASLIVGDPAAQPVLSEVRVETVPIVEASEPEPDDKALRAQKLFDRLGLHVHEFISAPGDSQKIIRAIAEPGAIGILERDKLFDTCRSAASDLGQILSTPDIDFTTRWSTEFGAWEISWYIGDSGVSAQRTESIDDSDGYGSVPLVESPVDMAGVIRLIESGAIVRGVEEIDGTIAIDAELLEDDSTPAEIKAEMAKVDTDPSDAQKEAGNYAMGHIKLYGLDISIENPKGSERCGKDANGKEWSVTMPAAYGQICGYGDGRDGDLPDCYVGTDLEAKSVYMVDQVDHKTGKFDEHKAMLAFPTKKQAKQAYIAGFSDGNGKDRIGAMTRMSVEDFINWLTDGDMKKPYGSLTEALGKPDEDDKDVYFSTNTETNIIELLKQDPNFKFESVSDFSPHRCFKGIWLPHRPPSQVITHWQAVLSQYGFNPGDMDFGYDEETGRIFIYILRSKLARPVNEALKHKYQTCGYDCGPTCIKMCADALGIARQYSIQDIIKVCGSDPVDGTDDKRMAKGMTALGLPFKIGTVKDTAGLADHLAHGSIIILRTLTRGYRHWIILHKFDGKVFHVMDPSAGQITYSPEEVYNIWSVRNFDYFEIPTVTEAKRFNRQSFLESTSPVTFQKVTNDVLSELQWALEAAFPAYTSWVVEYVLNRMDADLSVVAMQDGKVIGFYCIGDKQVIDGTFDMDWKEDLTPYANKRGVEGIALGVIPEARGLGIGNRLKDYPKSLGADYIWGMQMKSLNNLKDWLKRRRLVAANHEGYVTLQDF